MATGKKKDSMREGFEGGSENMSEERTDTVEEEGERLKKQREGEESKTEESLDEKPQGEELLTNEDTMNEEDGGGAASVENPSFLESEEGIERQEIDFNSRNAQEGNEEEREMKMKRQEMSERDRKFEEDIDHHNFLILNPFNEFLMRFNYTEVDNITSYAEELTKELRDSPLTFQHKNETRRVVVVLLTEFPEAESLLFAGLMKLNVIVQSTIAVAMIIGLLACLCMCRMMFLLKSR
ncbi:transmembrane protein [Cystoisospora suis]|uniref:Transmembrane protein n=1 Tax=Cystoisospora suis TaxID=483139 RepID=A0A2C6KHC0_9APIC|nr:transmembrane protein [Cystoisospora suis]